MQSNFKAISLSFKDAPVEIRELITLDDSLIQALLNDFREILGLNESLIISTCNRTEVYYTAESNLSDEIIGLIGAKLGITHVKKFVPFFRQFNTTEEAANYLFRVALGLEAQVVGDLQIINQVKRAYQLAADNNTAGPFLHRILHTVFFANKRVYQETAFRDGAASVSYASAELIRTMVGSFVNAKVLIIGLGEIGEDVAKHLADNEFSLTFTNRTDSKAVALAAELQQNHIPFKSLYKELDNYDIIVSSVPVRHFIQKKDLSEKHIGVQYLVDLSIPRSIDPEVESSKTVSLYNIDEIQEKTSRAVEKRLAAVPEVEAIISEAMKDVEEWSREMEVSPTIQKLKGALEDIRQEELKKHLKNVSPEVAHFAEKLSKGITQKIMKLPVLQLKAACKRGEADSLIDVLNDLFNLEQELKDK